MVVSDPDEWLLLADATINLTLGLLLLTLSEPLIELLGLPEGAGFYSWILGSVLFGIGIALLLEYRGRGGRFRGLGLEGAIAINCCGALALVAWLLFHQTTLPMRGRTVLWGISILVLGIGVVELRNRGIRQKHLKDLNRQEKTE